MSRLGILTGAGRLRRLAVWVACALVLAGLGVALAQRFVWPGLELDAAEEELRQNEPAAARARLERHLARWPDDGRALLLAAQAARRADACADAEQFLTRAEAASGTTDASRLEWSLLGAQQGDFADEEKRLRSAGGRNQAAAVVILEALAKGYAVCHRRQDAIEALTALLRHSPGHVPALLLRGSIQDNQRQTDPAEKDFREAVARASQSAAARAALAGLLSRRGNTREAISQYELALQLRPGDPAGLLGLARALTDDAQLDEAGRRLDELLAADPACADGLLERGRLALRRGKPAEAEPFLERATRAAPWHREAHQLYLVALKDLGRGEAAARCEDRLAQLKAEDEAVGRLRLRARDKPGDADIRWDLWLWCHRNGQDEEGHAWLLRVVMGAPHHAEAHAALAEYFAAAGQPRRAALHRAAAANATTPDARSGGNE
jgi:tetratricopeptide (TPR) repeat protein